jgi:LysM repeat protein
MFDISQVYGIKLDKLLARNGLVRGQEPEVNEKIRLRRSNAPLKPIKLKEKGSDPNPPAGQGQKPNKPKEDTMINDDDLDFEISPNEGKTQPSKPSTTDPSNPKPTFPGNKPPSTSEVPLPGDPRPKTDNLPSTPTSSTDGAVEPGYHRVVKGDTLYKLSRDYGTTVARLKQLNKLSSDDIKIGQVLRVE